MLLWQVHNDLARSIGDPIVATSLVIPDGVRYSASLRDQYLYRAMLELLSLYLRKMSAYPKYIMQKELSKIFVNYIERYTVATYTYTLSSNTFGLRSNPDLPNAGIWEGTMDADKVFYIMSLYAGTLPYTIEIPKREGAFGSLTRDMRNSQYPDCYFDTMQITDNGTEKLRIRAYDYAKELASVASSVTVEYIPYPTKPNYATPTMLFDFELSLYSQVINQATIYSLIDSQDIQNIEKFLYPEQAKG